jgi:hypothetical protein
MPLLIIQVNGRPTTAPVITDVEALSDQLWLALIHADLPSYQLGFGLSWRVEHSVDQMTWSEVFTIDAEHYELLNGEHLIGTPVLATVGTHFLRAKTVTSFGSGPYSAIFPMTVNG